MQQHYGFYLFICRLRNDTVSNSDYKASKGRDDKLERMCKEMANFKVLSYNLSAGTEKNYKNLCQVRRPTDMYPGTSK